MLALKTAGVVAVVATSPRVQAAAGGMLKPEELAAAAVGSQRHWEGPEASADPVRRQGAAERPEETRPRARSISSADLAAVAARRVRPVATERNRAAAVAVAETGPHRAATGERERSR